MMEMSSVRNLIKSGEGSIPYMYLDTRGNVTVGVGQLLSDVAAARALPFVKRETQARANSDEIEQDYNSVAQQAPGQVASAYRSHTSLDLPEDEINELLDRRIAEFQHGLQNDFQGYDAYPDDAKLALIDMAFNLGLNGLVSKFPKLKQAAESGQWQVCAQECRRRGISDERNNKTRELFDAASRDTDE